MTGELKPIETFYKGYRFRSRLEAKWAVFFDIAGIPYEYEPEGFELPSGKYLPDFYLPWFKCYVEIKPNYPEAITKGERNCRELRNGLDDGITMLCVGDPADDNIRLYCYVSDDSGGGTYEYDKAYFVRGASWIYTVNNTVELEMGNTRHWISIMVNEPRPDRSISTQKYDWCYAESLWAWNDFNDMYLLTGCRSEFAYAKLMARKARFEYGSDPIEKNDTDYRQSLPFSLNFWKFVMAAEIPKNLLHYHKITDGKYDLDDDWLERLHNMKVRNY